MKSMTQLARGIWRLSVLAVALSATASAQGSAGVSRPTPGPARPFVAPMIVTQTLPNGLRLAVVENHELPLVAVRMAVLGGPAVEPQGKEGLWNLMMLSLREGSTAHSGTAITDSLSILGSSMAWPGAGSSTPPLF